jgi:predicted glycoside hydrolase/deacetylase ChbG (UPF0249 family)
VDDFGLHPGICDASLQLVSQARVHAIGCMVGGAAWTDDYPCLVNLPSERLDLGLHLDLTERPLTQPGQALRQLIARAYTRSLDLPAVRTEIAAQLDAFESALGRRPAYVDGHQHVHQLPGVRQVLLEALSRRYAGDLPWLRRTRAVARTGRWRDSAKTALIAGLGARGLAAQARQLGFGQNRRLWGVYDFRGDESAYRARLAGWLRECGDGDLLMCHPGVSHDPGDALIDSRTVEFHVLSSTAFGLMLRAEAIQLQPMSRILADRVRTPRPQTAP